MNLGIRIYGTLLVLVTLLLSWYGGIWYYASYPIHERAIMIGLSTVFSFFMFYLIWRWYIRKWRGK
jgi:hypothetical protein